MKNCYVRGCQQNSHARGVCIKHYTHILRYGKPKEITRRTPNEYIKKDGYYEVILRNGDGQENARCKIDASDYEAISKHKWRLQADDNRYAHNSGVGYMHRFLMMPPPHFLIDHINFDGLDNRRDNLRAASHTQNQIHRRLGKNNTSGVTGVVKVVRRGKVKWSARCGGKKFGKKFIYFGLFDSFDEAVSARQNGVKNLFGEFANVR